MTANGAAELKTRRLPFQHQRDLFEPILSTNFCFALPERDALEGNVREHLDQYVAIKCSGSSVRRHEGKLVALLSRDCRICNMGSQ